MKKHFLILFVIITGLCVCDAVGIETKTLSLNSVTLIDCTLNKKCEPIQFDSTTKPTPYFTWGITKCATATSPYNTLPYGLTLNQLGVLSGVPAKPAKDGLYYANVCTVKNGIRVIRGTISISVTTATRPAIDTSLPITSASSGQFNLPDGQMDVPYIAAKGGYNFKATGGIPFLPTPDKPTGYNWSLSWGKIPTGMTFNTVGALSGIPRLDPKLSGNFTQPQTFTFNITATDAVLGNNTKTFKLKINPPVPPTIVTDCPLPEGLELYPYANVYLKAASGKKEYKWSVGPSTNPLPLNAFNRFPDGLKLSLAGTISGKPTLPGLFVFRLKVTDANGLTAEKECRINIRPAPEICTDKLFECASVGDDAGCFPMCAQGGGLPYTWSATGLPPALTINSTTGKICGNFTQAGNFTANITVRESFKGNTKSKSFPIVVKPKLEITTNSPLPWGIVGRSYPATASLSPVKIEAKGGWPPYTMWKVVLGKLPDGLTLDPDSGIISGTPKLKGSYKFTVQVIDSCGKVAFKEFIIDIYDPITLPTPPIPCLTVNKPFSTTLTASGGKGVLTWQIISVSSPAYTVTPTGVKTATLAGTPSDSAPLAIVVLVTDENGYAEEFTLNYSEVNAPLVITTNCPFPAGEVDKPYSAQLTATGGKQPYTWQILPQIYVADFNNNKIRKFYEGGIVKTYAGNGINQSIDGNLTASSFNGPYGMAFDAKGNLYVADRVKIRKISNSGNVTTLSGNYSSPEDMVIDDSGNVYVSDSNQNNIKKIDFSENVSTFVGNATGASGYQDGTGTVAAFHYVQGMCWDLNGNIILTDCKNNRVRKITTSGVVTTLAGTGANSYLDGNAFNAAFNLPHDVKVHQDGTIYVLDNKNQCIRKVSGNGLVSTLGFVRNLVTPWCLSVDKNGFVYVSDGESYHNISKISPNGNVTVIAGQSGAGDLDNVPPIQAKFSSPRGVEINPYEDLPLGLTLNSTTGVISGTPKKHGLYNITYRVTDACGNSAIKECQLTIAPALGPTLDCFAHMSDRLMADKLYSTPLENSDKIFSASESSNIVPAGNYPNNRLAFPNACKITFDSLAIGKNVRIIIYSGLNFTGEILLDQIGPALILNNYWQNPGVLPDGNLVINLIYTDPQLKDLFPRALRFWSESNMGDWANGSTKVICNDDIAAPSSIFLNGNAQTCVINAKSLVPNVSDKDLAETDHLVAIPFLIGKTEVTNEEYCVFLNAIAKQSDPRGLYSASMSSALNGGILRTGNAGAYAYTVKSGMENYPVLYVSWFDAARYVNWLSNDSPTGLQDKTTTEDGAYALNGDVSGVSIVRNATIPNTKLNPTRWLLNESEWFTSAYLKSSDSTSVSFWNYPMQSDTSPDLKLTNPKNLANYGNIFDGPTEVGFFSDSPSAFGTFDQGGNVREWTESVDSTKYRIIRGGSWSDSADAMKASESDVADPTLEDDKTGFRIGGEP